MSLGTSSEDPGPFKSFYGSILNKIWVSPFTIKYSKTLANLNCFLITCCNKNVNNDVTKFGLII